MSVAGYSHTPDALIDGVSSSIAWLPRIDAAACAASCDRLTGCKSFDWCPSLELSCNLNSADSLHGSYVCCSCGESNDCKGCDYYEKTLAPPAPPLLPPSPPMGCSGLDVVVVLDRSKSIGVRSWNTKVMPFLNSVLDSVAPSAATSTRFGVVVCACTRASNSLTLLHVCMFTSMSPKH